MKNLEQVRAQNALLTAAEEGIRGKDGGDVVNKVPGMIRNNGILAAAAFAVKKQGGHEKLFDGVAKHLASPELGWCEASSLGPLVGEMVGMPADKLRAVTAEALAFLGYVRRFHKGKE